MPTAKATDADLAGWIAKGLVQPDAGAMPAMAKGKRAPALVTAAHAVRLVVTVPLKVVSAANAREHWAAKHRRVAVEREAVKLAVFRCGFTTAALQGLTHQLGGTLPLSIAVTLTRLGGRKWDDDNNVSGLKAVRDAVANWWLMLDDGSDRVRFSYEQQPGGLVGVRITLEAQGECK